MTFAIDLTVLEQAHQLLVIMKMAEKAQLLQWVVRDLGDVAPGIESNPGVCGREPCIVRTRIPFNAVEAADTLLKALEGENQRTTA